MGEVILFFAVIFGAIAIAELTIAALWNWLRFPPPPFDD